MVIASDGNSSQITYSQQLNTHTQTHTQTHTDTHRHTHTHRHTQTHTDTHTQTFCDKVGLAVCSLAGGGLAHKRFLKMAADEVDECCSAPLTQRKHLQHHVAALCGEAGRKEGRRGKEGR